MHLGRIAICAAVTAALGWMAPGESSAERPPDAVPSVPHPSPAPARSLFDPARDMHVSEVRPGMTGYGLSVFHGEKIERFDVTALSVLRNFNPKYDVVLISCKGANLEHTGSIAGMSGSPIFLRDDAGHYRLIGAFAYGWPLAKDPIAGVQPIEYMLRLPTDDRQRVPAVGSAPAPAGAADLAHAKDAGLTWSLRDAATRWDRLVHPPAGLDAGPRGAGRLTGEGDVPELQPLATPLLVGGLPRSAMQLYGPAFRAAGLTLLRSGGGGGGDADSGGIARPAPKLEPGSSLAVPLLTGDVEMTALGTCTEVLGDRVYGFGHAFNGEGPVALPMGGGRVNGIVATLSTSFKLGAYTGTVGRLTVDQTVGVGGRLGEPATTVPIEIKVFDADGLSGSTESHEHDYHFRAALHPRFTPLIAGAAFSGAVSGVSELPQYNTVDYKVDLEFSNGRAVHVADRAVNTNAAELFQTVGLSLMAAGANPFGRVTLKKMTGEIHVAAQARQGEILDVTVPRSRFKPGETVKGYVTYKPFRAPAETMPVELDLPRDLPQGSYQLVISDADRFLQDEEATRPFQFTATSVGGIFDALGDLTSIRHDAIYLRLLRRPDGIAVGRTALPQLPSSRRQILLGAGRSDVTQFVSSTVKVIPTDRVIAGSAEFALTIEKSTGAEPGAARSATTRPAGGAKPREAHPTGRPLESPEPPAPTKPPVKPGEHSTQPTD